MWALCVSSVPAFDIQMWPCLLVPTKSSQPNVHIGMDPSRQCTASIPMFPTREIERMASGQLVTSSGKLHESRLSCSNRSNAISAFLHSNAQGYGMAKSSQVLWSVTKEASLTQSLRRFNAGIGPTKWFECAEKKNSLGAVTSSWGRWSLFLWRVRTFRFLVTAQSIRIGVWQIRRGNPAASANACAIAEYWEPYEDCNMFCWQRKVQLRKLPTGTDHPSSCTWLSHWPFGSWAVSCSGFLAGGYPWLAKALASQRYPAARNQMLVSRNQNPFKQNKQPSFRQIFKEGWQKHYKKPSSWCKYGNHQVCTGLSEN